ncbi:hypothetical protein J4455_02375 [Candidatus Woesearchaeota archaeon]|nr:hypothetical protein [Candidatus Woesearchaeota archaeon]
MRKNFIIFGVLVFLIIFTVIQTIQIYNLKKNFNDIKEISKDLNLESNQIVKDTQNSNEVPESLREVPSSVQGCFS